MYVAVDFEVPEPLRRTRVLAEGSEVRDAVAPASLLRHLPQFKLPPGELQNRHSLRKVVHCALRHPDA